MRYNKTLVGRLLIAICLPLLLLTALARPMTDARGTALPESPADVALDILGTYTSPTGDGAAEIVTYDADTQRLFVVNAEDNQVDVLDAADPADPILLTSISISAYGAGVNSVDFADDVLAVAVEADPTQDPGTVVFFDADGNYIHDVQVGALPDMLTFTPDGNYLLVANEGEPDDDYLIDPEGSISVIDVSGGVESATVNTADFTAFNGREAELRARGVRIMPDTGSSAAQEFEPEYIAVSPDSQTAFVTLQENNALAVLDIASATVEDVLPLNYKDHSRGSATLQTYTFENLPDLGTTATVNPSDPGQTTPGQTIQLGGLSGLWYEGTDAQGRLMFVTVPDRGPNGEPTDVDGDSDNERPFVLPDYQAQVVRFTLSETGELNITEILPLTRDGDTPITGLPNIPDVDETPVDLWGNLLSYDPYGADMEGVLIDPSGNFWMVDEYRPAIYQFDENGDLLNRFVPEGTADLAGEPADTFGQETLPADYLNRRPNRGFEGMALNADTGTLFAWIQTPLQNPDRDTSDNSDVIRMLGVDPNDGQPTTEYVYLLEGVDYREAKVDKIGDAVYAGNGRYYVIERDSSTSAYGKKYIYLVDTKGATNVLGTTVARAELSGDQEVPAVDTNANGRAVLNLTDAGDLLYTMYIDGLDLASAFGMTPTTTATDDDVTAMHFHQAARGANGGVVFDILADANTELRIASNGTAVVTGVWENAIADPTVATLRAAAPDADVDLYFNIHTNAVGSGELRGQLVRQTLEQFTADELNAVEIFPVYKQKITNLPSIGYWAGDKPEGLTLLPDGRLAVLNDNDFGLLDEEIPIDGTVPLNPNPVPVVLGLLTFAPDENRLDASNQDESINDGINILNWPVWGMYQPDTVASYAVDGQTYYVTANEGDARDYDGFSEEERIADLTLDDSVLLGTSFADLATLQANENLGRLHTTTQNGDIDRDGDFDYLHSYGARSFSIWDQYGNRIFDSGDDFETIIADQYREYFADNRSDDKGPEPEAVTTGWVGGRYLAFIGLERTSGVMVYDITDPWNATYLTYQRLPETDIAPEGLRFIAATDSPTGRPILAVANEVSGSTTLYAVDLRYQLYLPFVNADEVATQ